MSAIRRHGFDDFYDSLGGSCSFYTPGCMLKTNGRAEMTSDSFSFAAVFSEADIEMVERELATKANDLLRVRRQSGDPA
ncbi:MAG: hypothetical protein AAGD11_21115 [Planctomycetota bacterium]